MCFCIQNGLQTSDCNPRSDLFESLLPPSRFNCCWLSGPFKAGGAIISAFITHSEVLSAAQIGQLSPLNFKFSLYFLLHSWAMTSSWGIANTGKFWFLPNPVCYRIQNYRLLPNSVIFLCHIFLSNSRTSITGLSERVCVCFLINSYDAISLNSFYNILVLLIFYCYQMMTFDVLMLPWSLYGVLWAYVPAHSSEYLRKGIGVTFNVAT